MSNLHVLDVFFGDKELRNIPCNALQAGFASIVRYVSVCLNCVIVVYRGVRDREALEKYACMLCHSGEAGRQRHLQPFRYSPYN